MDVTFTLLAVDVPPDYTRRLIFPDCWDYKPASPDKPVAPGPALLAY